MLRSCYSFVCNCFIVFSGYCRVHMIPQRLSSPLTCRKLTLVQKLTFESRLPNKIDHLDLIEYLDSDRHNSNTTNVARSLDYLEHKIVHNMHGDGVCASDRVPKKS